MDEFQCLAKVEQAVLDESLTDKKGSFDHDKDLFKISDLVKLPMKPKNLAALMERYETEHAYLESLQLDKAIGEVFKTLEGALDLVHKLWPSPQESFFV